MKAVASALKPSKPASASQYLMLPRKKSLIPELFLLSKLTAWPQGVSDETMKGASICE